MRHVESTEQISKLAFFIHIMYIDAEAQSVKKTVTANLDPVCG
jgi:hypothetical protein